MKCLFGKYRNYVLVVHLGSEKLKDGGESETRKARDVFSEKQRKKMVLLLNKMLIILQTTTITKAFAV